MKKQTVWFENSPKVLNLDRESADQRIADSRLYTDNSETLDCESAVFRRLYRKVYAVFPDAVTLLYINDIGVSSKALVQLGNGVVVIQDLSDGEVSAMRTPQLQTVSLEIGAITDVSRVDDMLCLSTEERLYYCKVIDDNIYWLGDAPDAPQPEFALARSAVDGYSLTPQTLPSTTMHISANENAAEVVRRELKRYMLKVENEKLFAEPLLVYAALRFEDGNYGAPSPLAMMIPSSQPVLMRHLGETAVSDGKNVAVQFVSCPCNLMMRLRDTDIDKWRNFGVTHVDVFASQGVAMIDVDSACANVARRELSAFSHSGIAVAGTGGYSFVDNREEYIVGEGVVSNCFDTGARSESAINRDIVNISDFYLAASVSLDELRGRSSTIRNKFMKLDIVADFPISSLSDTSKVKSFRPDYSFCEIVGAKRLSATSEGIAALAPTVSCQTVTNVAYMGGYCVINGEEKCCLPRWRWCGSRDAAGLQLKNAAGQEISYDLTLHPKLYGSYAFDGMTAPRQLICMTVMRMLKWRRKNILATFFQPDVERCSIFRPKTERERATDRFWQCREV